MTSKRRLNNILKALNTFIEKVDPDWKKFHQIADKSVPDVRRAFLEAIADVQGGISAKEITDALSRGDYVAAENAVDWTLLAERLGVIAEVLKETMQEAMKEAAKQTGKQLGLDVIVNEGGSDARLGEIKGTFNLRNPEAEAWITQHSAELVTQVTEETRQAIRSIILEGQTKGIPPKRLARQIKDNIGLTERHAKAVLNYEAKLKASGFSEDKIAKEVERYRNKLLRLRAENIARTETITGTNAGQLDIWRQSAQQGLVPADVKKVWIVTPDDRTCKNICIPMHNQEVGLNEYFVTGTGGQVLHPAAHPSCRCAMKLSQ